MKVKRNLGKTIILTSYPRHFDEEWLPKKGIHAGDSGDKGLEGDLGEKEGESREERLLDVSGVKRKMRA